MKNYLRADEIKLYHIYKVYTMTGISFEKTFMPTRFEENKIKGIMDDEYFSYSMDGMYKDWVYSKKTEDEISKKEWTEYDEYESEYPERYVRYIFEKFFPI